jgi:hypothetical protein
MTLVRQFTLGLDASLGPLFVEDIDVMPGSPGTVAVSTRAANVSPAHRDVAIFDNGVQRPSTTSSGNPNSEVVFASPTRMYGVDNEIYYGTFRTLTVSAGGVAETSTTPLTAGGRLTYAGGRVYSANGAVVDPVAGSVLHQWTVTDNAQFAVDAGANRAYYLYSTFPDPTQRLHVFDTVSFAEVTSYVVDGLTGTPTAMVRWGSDGFAIATSDGHVVLASPTSTTVPAPPAPTPVVPAYPYKVLDQATSDLVTDPISGHLFASVPPWATTNPSSIVEIDPSSASIVRSLVVGGNPSPLAIADDGSMLYVGLQDTGSVKQYTLPALQFVREFPLGSSVLYGQRFPGDIAVMPGHPSTVAVTGTQSWDHTAIFDDGVQRQSVSAVMFTGSSQVQFDGPTRLYGVGDGSSGDLERMTVDANGITSVDESPHLIEEGGDLQFAGGLLYAGSGRVVDPQSRQVLAKMGGLFNSVVAEPALGRVWVIPTFGVAGAPWLLDVYDSTTYRLLETDSLPNFNGLSRQLVRWGADGLAFNTYDQATLGGQIYILSKGFAPPVVPPPVEPPPVVPPPVDTPDYFGEYTALPPQRLLDTRVAPGPLVAGGTINVPIEGVAGVPASDVVAVVLNVTSTGSLQPGFLTVYPSDEPLPTVSNVNYAEGQTVPNLVTVPLSLDGAVTIFSNAHTDVVVDIEGYYSDTLGTPGGRFRPTSPTRLFDTRDGTGGFGTTFGPSTTRRFDVNGRAGLPGGGVSAVVMNVTVTKPTASGFLTVFPDDATIPTVSNLNFVPAQTVPNLVIVKVPASGVIDIFNSAGRTDVIVDVVGYFDGDKTDESGRFVPFSPERLYDSRESTPAHPAGPLGAGESLIYSDQILASAYVLNVTATEPTSAGYLTVYPYPGDVPLASNVNFVAGQTVANLAYAPAGPDVGFFNSAGSTHIVVDLFGAFT